LKVSGVSNNINIRAAYLKKQQERDDWFKIVVKILRWKDNYFQKIDNSLTSKISSEEWQIYSKQVIKMSVTKGTPKVKKELESLETIIKNNNGFE
jgi:flagellar biosynthesis chaperone FliJ